MMIHPDQQNVRALCEIANFMDSGHQSFVEQFHGTKATEAAFFAGGSLVLKLIAHFSAAGYSQEEVEFLMNTLYDEVGEYMERHRIKIEWEPHVPTSWQQ